MLETLNDRQLEAVTTTEGPLLVLAGAGSGKTKVLTTRIAYLIKEKDINPANILAITFTNKAAKEMKSRVYQLLGSKASNIQISTFHSFGLLLIKENYEKLGFKVIPDGKEDRHDIIQAVEFHDPEKLIAFCEGIQKASPIDSHVTPIPWDMPGYDSQVIMAAGTFVSGASIELSADGPMKEPYAVYFQGGLTYPHAKYGIIMSLQRMAEKGLVEIPEIS